MAALHRLEERVEGIADGAGLGRWTVAAVGADSVEQRGRGVVWSGQVEAPGRFEGRTRSRHDGRDEGDG